MPRDLFAEAGIAPDAPAVGGRDLFAEAGIVSAEPAKRQVGAGEAFIDEATAGLHGLGRVGAAVVGSPLLAVDAVANKLTGEDTGASEWWAKTFFGPNQDAMDAAAAKRATTERSTGAEVAGAFGALAPMIPDMVLGSKIAPAMKVAEGTGAIGQLLTRAFAGAQPIAAHAGADRFAGAKEMGVDDLAAANAALGTYANMAAQGMAPMGAAGNLVKRVATGAAVNPVLAAAGRSIENVVNAPSGEARLQQEVFDPRQALLDFMVGGAMHGVMGERAPAKQGTQTAEALAADRQAYAAKEAATAEQRAAFEAGWQEFGPLLEANGIKMNDPRAETVLAHLAQRKQAAAESAETARQESPPSPEETALAAKQQPADVIHVDSQGRAENGDVGIKAGMMSAEGEKAKTEKQAKQAKQAFDLAARRQRQADAGLANNGQIDPDYQGGGAAARGGEFDSGVRRVTLLDGQPRLPNSEVALRSTSDTSKAVVRWLNEATGGSDIRQGNIDLSADKLDYMVGYATGGAGRFVMNLGKTVLDAATGEPVDYRKVPVTRLMAGDNRAAPYEHFNDATHEVQLATKEKKLGRETNVDLARLSSAESAARDFVKGQRDLLSKVQNNPNLTDSEREERETAINRRIESRMKQFLGRYYEAGGAKRSY